ncbi:MULTISPECIES: TetR/AcrR family transcriptional regulator [unclassified Rathayibacter]|uniref:TetR/AcrR family transcriptional regulator n=1 Tax=unclassified Rathayibacter TaxID=2609250 RepID=UPI000CE80DF2|nr:MULTISPECIES: TetR/AcrR family transcriptional regulator [unclassified Rathayibacter]PPG09871.1 TetR/AcrR family transcriptional regulator [Rathayibacter sp. AY2B1]PPG69071.1 TetR/AcrR family transcriptional regulator [Rathayibacter sp. AY1F4]
MAEQRALRRDARENIEKLHSAALEIFSARGLAAPLEDIARHAGVSIGTLYNRIGSREALIDAVIPAVAGAKLKDLTRRALAESSSRARLERFVSGMIDLQLEDPALNDAMLRRFPDATALINACTGSIELGRDLVDAAHRDGTLSPDFTHDDLMAILWMAGATSREAKAPLGWRRVLDRSLAGAWTTPSL